MKYYFETKDSEMCYSKGYFQKQMEELELPDIEVLEAEIMTNTGFFFCKKFETTGEIGNCGRGCHKYMPRNGKSGRCKHSGHVYQNTGKKVVLKTKL